MVLAISETPLVFVVTGDDVLSAWKAGAQHLLDLKSHRARNLITEITNPTFSDPIWFKDFCPKSVGAKDRLSVVAKVLFPARWPQPGQTRDQFYADWVKTLERGRTSKILHSTWKSTYFERLVSIGGSDNQIERAIKVLSTWERREAAIVMHLSAPHIDRLKPIGSPCLQYLEVLWCKDGTIDLVAVYRNHEFLNKTLGNFIGLGRLLKFIAAQSDKKPGRIVCHSVHAYTDAPNKLKQLISK